MTLSSGVPTTVALCDYKPKKKKQWVNILGEYARETQYSTSDCGLSHRRCPSVALEVMVHHARFFACHPAQYHMLYR